MEVMVHEQMREYTHCKKDEAEARLAWTQVLGSKSCWIGWQKPKGQYVSQLVRQSLSVIQATWGGITGTQSQPLKAQETGDFCSAPGVTANMQIRSDVSPAHDLPARHL